MIRTRQWLIAAGIGFTLSFAATTSSAEDRVLLDAGWRFQLGDVAGAQNAEFDDSGWRTLDLPHDWSIEGRTARDAASGGAGGFFPMGVGWYRKAFLADESWRDGRLAIEFEGVYENAEVWINGESLGTHPYGYTPFEFDLTPHVRLGEENVIAVRVDNSQQPNCRWYSGSGIYRHVWLRTYPALHLPPDGVFLWTERAVPDAATVRGQVVVRNLTDKPVEVAVEVELFAPDGGLAATDRQTATVAAGEEAVTAHRLQVAAPALWSPDTPSLCRAEVNLSVGGQVVDSLASRIGIRQVELSAAEGLRINGQPIELFGGNVHHDNGPLGAAAHDRAEQRRVEILKAAGFNAIRTSHNPPSTTFLNACDRLGMLVIDEAFDGWAQQKTPHDYSRVFGQWWERDVGAMIHRDRNHPSVIMWSIGNEVYERGSADGARRAAELAARVRQLDPTRPVTIALNGLGGSGDWSRLDRVFAAVDAAGYNYELHRHAEDHKRLPARIVFSSESFPRDAPADWQASVEQPYVIGAFVWSALDYLGEAGIGRAFPPGESALPHWEGNHFPWHGAACGDIDITGWRKPISHYRNIVWDRGEKIAIAVRTPPPAFGKWDLTLWAVPPALPSWTWPGHEGRELEVDVYSRYDSVRLYLNEQLVGEEPTGVGEQFRAQFRVPYQPGKLRADGILDGVVRADFEIESAGEPVRLRLSADRPTVRADGADLAFVYVSAQGEGGKWCPVADHAVRYTLTGPGRIVAIGSGDLTSTEPYNANPRRLYQGRTLVVIRTTREPGTLQLTATADGLAEGTVNIQSETNE